MKDCEPQARFVDRGNLVYPSVKCGRREKHDKECIVRGAKYAGILLEIAAALIGAVKNKLCCVRLRIQSAGCYHWRQMKLKVAHWNGDE